MVEHDALLHEFQEFAKATPTAKSVMEHMARRLHEEKARYNWVGFTSSIRPILVVGPYVGSFTPNLRIPLGTDLGGAAASSAKTVVVDDVRKDPRSSSLVISELVVPIS